MTNAAQSAIGRVGAGILAVCALPLLSAAVLLLAHKTEPVAAAGIGLFFLALSIFLLAGDIFHRAVYCVFIFQFVSSWLFSPIPLMATVASLAFLPLALDTARLKEISFIPNVKPLMLLLLGCAVSLIFQSLSNDGGFNYYLKFDIFLILGLVFAYELFLLCKQKILTPEKLIFCVAVSGLALICYVFALYVISGAPWLFFNERAGASVGVNPNIIASYLDLTLPCAFFTAFFEKRNRLKRWALYAVALIYVIIIFMAETRGSVPGIALIGLYVIWRKRSWAMLCGAAVCAAVAVATVGASVWERTLNPSAADIVSNMGRVEFLNSAFRILKDNHYFFGVGMNNFSVMKFGYGIPQWFDTSMGASSHNFFIEIWLGWGMLGLLGWLLFNGAIVTSLIRKGKDSGAVHAVIFAILMFSAHGIFDSMCANYSIMLTYFSLAGAGLFLMTQPDGVFDRPGA